MKVHFRMLGPNGFIVLCADKSDDAVTTRVEARVTCPSCQAKLHEIAALGAVAGSA